MTIQVMGKVLLKQEIESRIAEAQTSLGGEKTDSRRKRKP